MWPWIKMLHYHNHYFQGDCVANRFFCVFEEFKAEPCYMMSFCLNCLNLKLFSNCLNRAGWKGVNKPTSISLTHVNASSQKMDFYLEGVFPSQLTGAGADKNLCLHHYRVLLHDKCCWFYPDFLTVDKSQMSAGVSGFFVQGKGADKLCKQNCHSARG